MPPPALKSSLTITHAIFLTYLYPKFTETPNAVYISFSFHILNSIGPLLYLFDSQDHTHFEVTIQNIFAAVVLVAVIVAYAACFVCKKPINGQADYLFYYLIITVTIIIKAFVFVEQHDGKSHDVDYTVNMMGIVMESLELCVDILLSKCLLAKLHRAFMKQDRSATNCIAFSNIYDNPHAY